MKLKRRKSRADQVKDLLATYLKIKAATKVAKGATKAAKGTAAYKVASKTPVVKRLPLIAGAGVAAFAATRAARSTGGGGSAPA
jgi:hypothetical protein